MRPIIIPFAIIFWFGLASSTDIVEPEFDPKSSKNQDSQNSVLDDTEHVVLDITPWHMVTEHNDPNKKSDPFTDFILDQDDSGYSPSSPDQDDSDYNPLSWDQDDDHKGIEYFYRSRGYSF